MLLLLLPPLTRKVSFRKEIVFLFVFGKKAVELLGRKNELIATVASRVHAATKNQIDLIRVECIFSVFGSDNVGWEIVGGLVLALP